MADEKVDLKLDAETVKMIQKTAERHGMDLSEFVTGAVMDRAIHGEFERARLLLDRFVETVTDVVKESDTLSHLAESDKQLFIAAMTGAVRAMKLVVPKVLMEMQRDAAGMTRKLEKIKG